MGEFRFQAGIALFIQIIVVNGDKWVQVPVLRTYNPFAVQKGELVHILPLVLHLQKGEDMGVVIGKGILVFSTRIPASIFQDFPKDVFNVIYPALIFSL